MSAAQPSPPMARRPHPKFPRGARARSARQPVSRPADPPGDVPSLRYASSYHAPVLAREVVDALVTDPTGVYVDGTLGGGGHTAALLDALAPEGRVIGIDRDPEALAAASARLAEANAAGRFLPLRGSFAEMEALLKDAGIADVDGVLLDLGVSSHQLDEATRGFAFSVAGPLDMRMDPAAKTTAADLVNTLDERALADILYLYGEEPRSRPIAREVVRRRPLETTDALADAVRAVVPMREQTKALARVFQALRIAVNGEMEALEAALGAALRVLKPGGRLAVIAYHSLEDRRVKHFLRYGNLAGTPEKDFYGRLLTPWTLLTKKAIEASEEEVAANPRARSARLRIAEKTPAHDPPRRRDP